jgi:hypothetical protein
MRLASGNSRCYADLDMYVHSLSQHNPTAEDRGQDEEILLVHRQNQRDLVELYARRIELIASHKESHTSWPRTSEISAQPSWETIEFVQFGRPMAETAPVISDEAIEPFDLRVPLTFTPARPVFSRDMVRDLARETWCWFSTSSPADYLRHGRIDWLSWRSFHTGR